MKLGWATDIHLDWIVNKPGKFERFVESALGQRLDSMVVTGDIANGATWAKWLSKLRDAVGVPVYFVLGNHDYWGSSIYETNRLAKELSDAAPDSPKWLTAARVVKLTDTISLVGHDGWYDCEGMEHPLRVIMNDWSYILDFRPMSSMYAGVYSHDPYQIAAVSKRLADDAGKHLQDVICEAFAGGAEEVICATHVPPFKEASLYKGKSDSPNIAFFSAQIIGNRLKMVMEGFAGKKLRVLCGHTHERALYQAAPNLTVIAGGAHYGSPKMQTPLEF